MTWGVADAHKTAKISRNLYYAKGSRSRDVGEGRPGCRQNCRQQLIRRHLRIGRILAPYSPFADAFGGYLLPPLEDSEPAVHVQDDSLHVAGLFARQKQRRGGDVPGLGNSSCGDDGFHPRAGFGIGEA